MRYEQLFSTFENNSPTFWLIDNLWMPLARQLSYERKLLPLSGPGCGTARCGCYPQPPTPLLTGPVRTGGPMHSHAGGESRPGRTGRSGFQCPGSLEHSFTVDVSPIHGSYSPGFEMLLGAWQHAQRATTCCSHASTLDGTEECSREFVIPGCFRLRIPMKRKHGWVRGTVNPIIKRFSGYCSLNEALRPHTCWSRKGHGPSWRVLGKDGRSYSLMGTYLCRGLDHLTLMNRMSDLIWLIGWGFDDPWRCRVRAVGGTVAYIPARYVFWLSDRFGPSWLLNFTCLAASRRVITDLSVADSGRFFRAASSSVNCYRQMKAKGMNAALPIHFAMVARLIPCSP